MMNEYVIAKYIRLSLDDAVTESMSIPHQHLLLDKHIEGLDIPNAEVLEFVDNGYTGTNLERPAVQEMLDLVQKGKVNCIVTKDFSRLSRNEIESGYYIEQIFPLYRIRFISVGDGFDSDDHIDGSGGLEVAFKFLMHEYYSRDLSKKVKSAKRAQMLSGENIVANAIYGYQKNDAGKWEPDEAAAAVVRQIFKMALEGMPTAAIRDSLCAAKHPTPREYIEMKRGKEIDAACLWTARMVLHMLENEQYTGAYVSGKQESKAVGSHSKIHTDKSEWIIIPDRHPPIISKEDFAAVKGLLGRFKGSTTVKPVGNLMQDEDRYKRTRMVSGEWIAATPIYGYAKTESGKWEIDDMAAGVVREIYDMALQGMKCAGISGRLSEKGYPTPSEHVMRARGHDIAPLCQWTAKSVRNILKNVQYTGAFVSGKILKDYETGKSFHTPESDWIIIPGKNRPIISQEAFDEVQEITANSRVRRRNVQPRDYLLYGGIVKCGCCGYGLAYDPIADPVFRCHRSAADLSAECHKMKVSARELDESVLAIIRKQAEVVLASNDLSGFHKKTADVQKMEDHEAQIRHLVQQRQMSYEQFINGEIDKDTFDSLKAGYAKQIDILNNQRAIMKQAERDRGAHEKAAKIAKNALSEKATPKDIVNAMIDKILVYPGNHIEIHWKFENFADNIETEVLDNVG
ncbi:MAG: recombinase family protein [Defluviitaleaceae bacterium]|nr:recombinase family protein [Defluviitaleaceae bacterium]